MLLSGSSGVGWLVSLQGSERKGYSQRNKPAKKKDELLHPAFSIQLPASPQKPLQRKIQNLRKNRGCRYVKKI